MRNHSPLPVEWTLKASCIALLLALIAPTLACRGCLKSHAAALPKVSKAAVTTAVKGNNQFALSMYSKLAKENDGNLVFSPYSIATALAMTSAGAKGKTGQEMRAVLHHNLPGKTLHKAQAWLSIDLNHRGKQGDFKLSIANRLWGQQGMKLQPRFLALLSSSYGAALKTLDFKETPKSRQIINQWVEKQTQQRIKDLLPKGSIGASTRLVLTNAIYFKGSWASKFKKSDTASAPFSLDAKRKINVPMMKQVIKKARVMQNAQLKAIALPYKGKSLSMVLLLPNKVDGLAALEKQLSPAKLQGWISAMYETRKTYLSVPRFKMTHKFKLKPQLTTMGMPTAFSPKADLSGINGKKDLYIDEVYHKAFVLVNEEGTEAAAATAVVAKEKSASRPFAFHANRPFLFLIRDNNTGSILFLGRLKDPR